MKKTTICNLRLLACCIVMLVVRGLTFAQNTSLPYFNGFENSQDTIGWTFKRRAGYSNFEVGNAAHRIGCKSMYISPDSGATATYATTPSGHVSIAYKSFTLSAGTYTLAFDYQCGGDGTNQDMKVAFAPSSVSLNSSYFGSYPNTITNNQFTDDAGNNTFSKSAWQHVTGTITVNTAGTYNLCFAFRTNSQTVTAPGACVDNIQFDTLKTSTDCTQVPCNIQVVRDPQYGTIVSWEGNATEYEMIATPLSSPYATSYCQHTGITTNTDTIQFSELIDGLYLIYVRAICGSDTSMYGENNNVLIYDASARCIDFANFYIIGTLCTYGSYSNPYQTVGFIDNGPSQMTSRHTVHADQNETDPRTDGGLHTVPAGELMSVRLGNWNDGAEAESVTYTYNIPAGSNQILLMKYAVVFEEPAHDDPPEFTLELLNANNQALSPSSCTKYETLCTGSQESWHICQSSENTSIWYKDWTTVGMNLSQYAGQTIKIRLTTADCNWGGHYGYAYFTLDCTQAEITGASCGTGSTAVLKAPDGFDYLWINKKTYQTVSTAQTLSVSESDTSTYICNCLLKDNPNCFFSLTAYAIPRIPESSFSYSVTHSNCQTHITFTNNSQVYTLQNGTKTYRPNERITSQTWSVNTRHTDRIYYNMVSSDKTLATLDIPMEGDTIDITLISWINGCDDDTTITIIVPSLQASLNITNSYVCLNEPVTFNGEQYTFIIRDSVRIVDGTTGNIRYMTLSDSAESIKVIDTLSSWCGCDSVVELNLKVLVADTVNIEDTIRFNQGYCLKVADVNGNTVLDTCVFDAGYHNFHVPGSLDCDSLYYNVHLVEDEGLGIESIIPVRMYIVPNPVNSGKTVYIYGEFGDVKSVKILNSIGQVVGSFVPSGYPIEVRGIETSGLYYIHLNTTEGKIVTKKLIVN